MSLKLFAPKALPFQRWADFFVFASTWFFHATTKALNNWIANEHQIFDF
jgi:hypothetical protein